MEKLETKTHVGEAKSSAMRHLKIYDKADVLSLTRIRRFETKLGERLQVLHDATDIAKSIATTTAKYIFTGSFCKSMKDFI